MLSRWPRLRHVSGFGTCPTPRALRQRVRPYADLAKTDEQNHDVRLTRNIGIIAHIDAGKTTTTERMLYYNVDEGSTVTDFLPAERARGITIQSAAISFSWPRLPSPSVSPSNVANDKSGPALMPHNINLIDTPGHADFTFEVLRSLRVLDGAICVLDGVAGVEAQTEKVWTQAVNYAIPRIIFVNKLDRDGAAFGRTIKVIAARLGVWPAVCGLPWFTPDGSLQGICDVVGLRCLKYKTGGDGKQIEVVELAELSSRDPNTREELIKARIALVELLAEHDDQMVEHFLNVEEDHLAIGSHDILQSLRRCVLQHPQKVVPVFAGASFRNIGVQPLIDAVVNLLPSPHERPDSEITFGSASQQPFSLSAFLSGKDLTSESNKSRKPNKIVARDRNSFALQNIEACALAFKVVADAKRGVLVYVRVYSGVLNKLALMWNTNLQVSERATRLMKMFANDAVDIEAIPAGQIGVIPGLKFARTGDTLVTYKGINPKTGPPAPMNQLQLRPIQAPPPVFFVGVEPNSLAEEKPMREALDLLLREDPSLHVTTDEESGQTHLAGMGELHLEIARDRLIQDLKAKARIGKVEIGYREAIVSESDEMIEMYDRMIGGKSAQAACIAKITLASDNTTSDSDMHLIDLTDNNTITIHTPGLDNDGHPLNADSTELSDQLRLPVILQALKSGVQAALARGPIHGYAMHSTDIRLTFDISKHIFPTSTPAAVSAAARLAVTSALKQSAQSSATVLMEPVMKVVISVDEDSLGAVVHDISSARGGTVMSLNTDDGEMLNNSLATAEIERVYAPPDPFAGGGDSVGLGSSSPGGAREIIARVPLKEMVGYLKHLRSLTAGRGTFTMTVDKFEKMAAQRQKAVLNELRGDLV